MNIDHIKKRLQALQSNRSNDFWKPSYGQHIIRIVPYKFEPSYPFRELQFHYGIAGKTYLSPASFGDPDPFIEFADKLRAQGDKESWTLSRKFLPRLRTFAPIIVRGEENEGVRFWGFGKTVYQELLTIMAEPDYGDITDPMEGHDIKMIYTSAEENGTQFPQTKILVRPKPTPLHEDEETAKKFLENQKDITTLYTLLGYDELKDVMEKWIDGTTDDAEEEESDDDFESPTVSKSASEKKSSTNKFDELFDELPI